MGFWSELFGESKCDKMPSQKYSNMPEDGQDGANAERIKPQPPTKEELRSRFIVLRDLLDEEASIVTWPGFKISTSSSSIKLELTHIASDQTMSAYSDGDVFGTKSRVFQQLGVTTLAGFVSTLENLIEAGTIKIERTAKGKLMELNLPQHVIMVSKCNKIAYRCSGISSLRIFNISHDSDLNLDYVDSKSFDVKCRSTFDLDCHGYNSWEVQYEQALKLANGDFEQIDVSLEEHWLDEYSQDQLRSRILRERELDQWVQEIITLHSRYNENAKKYLFAEAGPLDSPEAIYIFLHLVKRKHGEFTTEELTNYLQFKQMLKVNYNTGDATQQCPRAIEDQRRRNYENRALHNLMISHSYNRLN